MARLTPDGLSRKTMRNILAESMHKFPDEDPVLIDNIEYDSIILESEYNEEWQIAGKEGDLIFFDMVTYGYGESISWGKLQAQKESLEAWAKDICEKHHCAYEIAVSANYW
jgi:hypothetical protein